MRTVVLNVRAHEQTQLKIVWGEGDDTPLCFDPYIIYRGQLSESVEECRVLLGDLVEAFIEEDVSQYSTILRKLAEKGTELQFLLFRGAAENVEEAEKVEQWLKDEVEGPTRLIVSSDASIHVPWGLVFAGRVEEIPNGSDKLVDYQSFWALKYQLTVLYSGMAPKSLRIPRKREGFRTLSMLNRQAFEEGASSMEGAAHEALSRFLQFPEGVADNLELCKTKWPLLIDKDCLLYVFAHATGTAIELSDVDRITVTTFRRLFLEPRRRLRGRVPECLIIFNGCETAVGELDNSFLTATAEAGCCGFIGSEAAVPTEFAARFGTALLHLLLHSGVSVLEAVDQLRRQHWPLGILYGCYSHPDFRVEADPQPPSPPFGPESNFSRVESNE